MSLVDVIFLGGVGSNYVFGNLPLYAIFNYPVMEYTSLLHVFHFCLFLKT